MVFINSVMNMLPNKKNINNCETSQFNLPLEEAIRVHFRILGHCGYGITELRTFDGVPMVAYVDNEEDAVRLCRQMEGKKTGIYIGVQPRPLYLFEQAPNCWRPAYSRPYSNCACDNDIEYITTCFFDIDVVSEQRQAGHPASDEELEYSLKAPLLFCREAGFALSSTICCSGNGFYVITPIVPIPVDNELVPLQFKCFCNYLADKIAGQVTGVKFDPVFNLSRVMRVMGTTNGKGTATPDRPHRQACFITEPLPVRSVSLHHMILNTDVPVSLGKKTILKDMIKGDLKKLGNCEFIQWCRKHPEKVSEPQWFGLISNLAPLKGGVELFHEISRLDRSRYDYQQTQAMIERVQKSRYRPVNCLNIIQKGFNRTGYGCFNCSQISNCTARAPIYLTAKYTVYSKQ
jgi:hypothetical protein